MTVARRGVRLARLAIAAQKRVGKVAVAFSIDATNDIPGDGDTFNAARPHGRRRVARPGDPRGALRAPADARADRPLLDATRLPLWLSLPRAPRSIEWLEQRGKRTRRVDPGLVEITQMVI